MRGPKEKKERALGERLGLKAERCLSPKCAMVRKPYKPGVHGQSKRPRNLSEFGIQLKEKQKIKITYDIKESQLRDIFKKATKAKKVTGTKVFELLESRLDNVVFRSSLALSRTIARQVIIHGHILVNGRKVISPGFEVSPGNLVSVKESSKEKGVFKRIAEISKKIDTPTWIVLDKDKFEAKIAALPSESDIPFDVNMVVDYYSK